MIPTPAAMLQKYIYDTIDTGLTGAVIAFLSPFLILLPTGVMLYGYGLPPTSFYIEVAMVFNIVLGCAISLAFAAAFKIREDTVRPLSKSVSCVYAFAIFNAAASMMLYSQPS